MPGTAQPSDIKGDDPVTRHRYTFGDSDLAASRLALLADVFAESSRRFIRAAASHPIRTAVDLGCGPGFTTHLVAETSHSSRTIGLDNSVSFLELARESATENVRFQRHDVRTVPFPEAPADLIYCRFLLTHLSEPVESLNLWTTQLTEGGVLLIDEVEQVETSHPVLLRYQAAVNALLSGEGQRLEIGSVLDAADMPAGVHRMSSHVVVVAPAPTEVGQMFHANLRSWRSDPRLIEKFGNAYLNDLERDLAAVVRGEIAASARWHIRQMSYERR